MKEATEGTSVRSDDGASGGVAISKSSLAAREIASVTLSLSAKPVAEVATFAGGLVWAYVYQRAPNFLALALSHALMSMLRALSLPPATINSLRVGIKYFG